jgi:hypothetical protein
MAKLTYDQVVAITGRSGLDDEQIAAIIATGATAAEVIEAWAWINQEDDYLAAELERPLTGNVAAVYDLLSASRPREENEH